MVGGTGMGAPLAELGGSPMFVPTPAGGLRGKVVELPGLRLIYVSRHSAGHKVPPHLVNYKAMALGLRKLGVKACFATAAVGSIRNMWGPGTLVLCSDYLDFSSRNITLFDDSITHRDFSEPFSKMGREAILAEANSTGVAVVPDGVYVNANGPRYETPQEIRTYRELGGDVVGMTAASEAIAMREAEVPYTCLAVVTNLAAGLTDGVLGHEEVVDVMTERGPAVLKLLLGAAERVASE